LPPDDSFRPDSPGRHTRRSRWVRALRFVAGLGVALVTLAAAGALWEARAEATDARAYPPPGRLIDVGGHRLHLACAGTGSTTVVIDAGLGDWSTAWSLVQPEVARSTRTCTYDRAGSVWSDPGPQPRVASVFAHDLHTLLARADVPGPYVLVGHSMGGLTMQLFARDYPSEVAGLVLIDSMNSGAPAPQASEVHAPAALPRAVAFFVRGAGHLGVARILTVLGDPLGSAPAALSPEAAGASVARGVLPHHLEAFAAEFLGISAGIAEAAGVRSLGDLPVTVLTAGGNPDPAWPAKQADLLRLSSRSTQVVSESSGHNVHLERPADAVAAIIEMVTSAR
jgi:pimeloyl-ACP methyl ester carboxylesterase